MSNNIFSLLCTSDQAQEGKMASMQCGRNDEMGMQLSSNEKASLDDIIKQVECFCESQQIMQQSHDMVVKNEVMGIFPAINIRITMVQGGLKNQTKGPLRLMSTNKYAGHIVKNFPGSLTGVGAFTVSAMSDKGVKAAVVYSGKNKSDVDCAWLLAFADTKSTGRRIYGECGRKGKFNNIKWNEVEKNLDKAGAIAKPSDKETGTSLYATIVGSTGKSVVGSAFLG